MKRARRFAGRRDHGLLSPTERRAHAGLDQLRDALFRELHDEA
jgi:hypothetical protein